MSLPTGIYSQTLQSYYNLGISNSSQRQRSDVNYPAALSSRLMTRKMAWMRTEAVRERSEVDYQTMESS